jgi:ribosomal protein S18 acetylase RimI-like enzyme
VHLQIFHHAAYRPARPYRSHGLCHRTFRIHEGALLPRMQKRGRYFGLMTRSIHLRQASADDYAFALQLYLSTMRPYTELLMIWDESKQRASFATQWKADEVKIVAVDGNDVGWFQVSETPGEIHLQQLFISPEHQRIGIGTKVLSDLVAAWKGTQKPITLTVLKSNPARRLYERFAFSVVGDVGVKYKMMRYSSS